MRRCLAALLATMSAGGPACAQTAVPSGPGPRPPADAAAPAETALPAARSPQAASPEGSWFGPGLVLPAEERFQARAQLTWVRQHKPSFSAPYTGPNSLGPQAERSYSFTSTLMLGARAWRGGELYLNPEVAQGVPLSGLAGLGGFPNAELARTAGSRPVAYLARLFLRQTWGFGGGSGSGNDRGSGNSRGGSGHGNGRGDYSDSGGGRLPVQSDQNQLGGAVDARRLVVTAGILPLIDLFDDNAYSHDPRTQFMNWSLVTHGAFDFAADARGYSRGVALEWFDVGWAVRAGRFAQPRVSNGLVLNPALGRSFGDQVEVERAWRVRGEPGKMRLLAYRNRAVMGAFSDALAAAAARGGTPEVGAVRRDSTKAGFGINLEQRLGRWGGAFLRASRHDGRTESYAYTEIDRSISGGVLLDGQRWGRADDTLGLGFARNGLSGPHRAYLAAGGLGFFLGDGRLNYRPETIVEVFYAMGVARRTWLSLNAQHLRHPGYNADRGPANVLGVRFHANF